MFYRIFLEFNDGFQTYPSLESISSQAVFIEDSDDKATVALQKFMAGISRIPGIVLKEVTLFQYRIERPSENGTIASGNDTVIFTWFSFIDTVSFEEKISKRVSQIQE